MPRFAHAVALTSFVSFVYASARSGGGWPTAGLAAAALALVLAARLSYRTRREGYDRVTYFSVRNVVAVCCTLFVPGLAFLAVAKGREASAPSDAYWSRSLLSKLALAIRQIEEDDDRGLAERAKKFGETKRKLQERVSNLAEQFAKLAAIRKEIAGLFEKLGGAVNASAN